MHETFTRASFGIAVFEIPTGRLERRLSSAGGVIFVVVERGAIAGSIRILFAFGREAVFLMANHDSTKA